MHDLSLLPSPAARVVLRTLMQTAGRWIELHGAERLRQVPDPAIFAFNHNNSYEAILVPAALMLHRRGRPIHFLVDWMFLQIPVAGWLIRRIDPIPVYTKPARWRLWNAHRRERYLESPIPACLERLRRGQSVGIFPEGTRNPDLTRLLPGRRGVGTLVLACEAPVVPVGIDFPAGARLGRMPYLGRIRITVGEPLAFRAERAAFAAAGRARDRDLAQSVAHQVMEAVSRLCSKSYPHARPRPAPSVRQPILTEVS